MSKTALQLHIEDLEKAKDALAVIDKIAYQSVQSCIDNAKHFIETEKQQIIDAYNDGYGQGADLDIGYDSDYFASKYSTTFTDKKDNNEK